MPGTPTGFQDTTGVRRLLSRTRLEFALWVSLQIRQPAHIVNSEYQAGRWRSRQSAGRKIGFRRASGVTAAPPGAGNSGLERWGYGGGFRGRPKWLRFGLLCLLFLAFPAFHFVLSGNEKRHRKWSRKPPYTQMSPGFERNALARHGPHAPGGRQGGSASRQSRPLRHTIPRVP